MNPPPAAAAEVPATAAEAPAAAAEAPAAAAEAPAAAAKPSAADKARVEKAWRKHVGSLTLQQMTSATECLAHLQSFTGGPGVVVPATSDGAHEVVGCFLRTRHAPTAEAMAALVKVEQQFAQARAVEEILEQMRVAAEQGVGRSAWVAFKSLRAFRPFMTGPLAGWKGVVASLIDLGYLVATNVSLDGKTVKIRLSCLAEDREQERLAKLPDRAKPRVMWWEQPSSIAKPPAEDE